jgi:hypothetical protein
MVVTKHPMGFSTRINLDNDFTINYIYIYSPRSHSAAFPHRAACRCKDCIWRQWHRQKNLLQNVQWGANLGPKFTTKVYVWDSLTIERVLLSIITHGSQKWCHIPNNVFWSNHVWDAPNSKLSFCFLGFIRKIPWTGNIGERWGGSRKATG